ncbi:MAG: AAA family ATPase [Hyphomicrobium sp.]
MRNSIAIMNTKGGVGKSTLVLALAETISAYHKKNVLVIDSDAQASVSSMLMSVSSLYKLQSEGATIVDYLHGRVLKNQVIDWPKFIVRNVSDVDDARSVFLLPSDMQLTPARARGLQGEPARAPARGDRRIAQRRAPCVRHRSHRLPAGALGSHRVLAARGRLPHLADQGRLCVGVRAGGVPPFQGLNPEMGFAQNLGVIINMKETNSASDEEYHRWLQDNPENACFSQAIPRMPALQDAAQLPDLRAQLPRQVSRPGRRGGPQPHHGSDGANRRGGAGERRNRRTGRGERLRRDSSDREC